MTRVTVPYDMRTFARYATVGIASNSLLYALYLALGSGVGLAPVVAASIGWATSVLFGFLLNRSWTFGHAGPRRTTFARYGLLYVAAYTLNVILLMLLVDRAGLPHELVQGVLIVLFGVGLFLGQRLWVFRPEDDR